MAEWKNLDELDSFKELQKLKDEVVLKEAMEGSAMRRYSMPFRRFPMRPV